MTDISSLQSLLSSLVSERDFELDNRTVESNLQFVERYSKDIPFAGGDRSNWADVLFMDGYTPEKLALVYQDPTLAGGTLLPQQALLLSAFKLLETPRALLNILPYAHRELYYRQLLGLTERLAEPARVALSFELSENVAELLVPAFTEFPAGQDRHGTPIQFMLDEDVLANRSQWTDLRWCSPPPPGVAGSKSCIAYDEAGKIPWPTSGLRLFSHHLQERYITSGKLVASELLTLEDGGGAYSVTFASDIQTTRITACEISDGDKWLPLQLDTPSGQVTTLTFTLADDAGPATAPRNLDGLTLDVPALKITCDDQLPLPEIVAMQVNSSAIVQNGFQQYELTPFGYSTQFQPVTAPQLYLGFTEIEPGQSLLLFWQLHGASTLSIIWEYLNIANRWAPLDATVVDRTLGLFRSGCWTAALPADASNSALSMPAGRYWIRAVMSGQVMGSDASNYPIVYGLLTNGMTATLLKPELLDAETLLSPLPADSITQPATAIAGLASTQQPWSSSGGRPKESTQMFFKRSAQRLASRNRALTWDDMAAMLKTRFKAVFTVIPPPLHKRATVPALHVQSLVVIPYNSDKDNSDPLRPILCQATLDEMAEYLRGHASLWQNIRIINPTYRDVSVEYLIEFRRGVNPDYGYRQVWTALERHYMPWATGLAVGAVSAGQIDYYELIAQIQQQPLVEHLVELTLDGDSHSIYSADHEVLILCRATPRPLDPVRKGYNER